VYHKFVSDTVYWKLKDFGERCMLWVTGYGLWVYEFYEIRIR